MKLLQLGFANFRSIGSSPIVIDLRRRVNLIIGANNSGKSNVLEILRRLRTKQLDKLDFTETDLHRRDGKNGFELIADVEGDDPAELPPGVRRFHLRLEGGRISALATPFDGLTHRQFVPLMTRWLSQYFADAPTADDLDRMMKNAALAAVGALSVTMPEVHFIPQFRRITAGEYALEGTGIVELLGRWKSPDIGAEADRDKFAKVQQFLRELLDLQDITLDVSRANSELIVEQGNLRLPLSHHGTGIHQLIILAIAVLARDDALIAIEEPEAHLHPLLQKAFLKFLIEKTTNNYVITTHSNAFLSRPSESRITHLWIEGAETKNRAVETPEHTLQVLSDLGIRPADLLQANFVIWVEGPAIGFT